MYVHMITNLENKHYASTYVLLNTDIPCKVVILKSTSLVSLIEGHAFTVKTLIRAAALIKFSGYLGGSNLSAAVN